MLLGGVALAALAGVRSARRQARPQPHRVVRLITSASWAILPIVSTCAVLMPLYLGTGASSTELGPYGEAVWSLVAGYATFWVTVALGVGVIMWARFGKPLG